MNIHPSTLLNHLARVEAESMNDDNFCEIPPRFDDTPEPETTPPKNSQFSRSTLSLESSQRALLPGYKKNPEELRSFILHMHGGVQQQELYDDYKATLSDATFFSLRPRHEEGLVYEIRGNNVFHLFRAFCRRRVSEIGSLENSDKVCPGLQIRYTVQV